MNQLSFDWLVAINIILLDGKKRTNFYAYIKKMLKVSVIKKEKKSLIIGRIGKYLHSWKVFVSTYTLVGKSKK